MSAISNQKPSRGDAETACLLHALGTDGCSVARLAARLGLDGSHAPALANCVRSLADRGWVRHEDDHVSLSDAGRDWMHALLSPRGRRALPNGH